MASIPLVLEIKHMYKNNKIIKEKVYKLECEKCKKIIFKNLKQLNKKDKEEIKYAVESQTKFKFYCKECSNLNKT